MQYFRRAYFCRKQHSGEIIEQTITITMTITREQAYNLMCEWVKSESLRKHMLCVEAAMRAYAKKYGGDVEEWLEERKRVAREPKPKKGRKK
jgi:predicted hydrolase (HD superfamily)